MRGIRLNHGVTFVECEGVTVRIGRNGKCELSPIMLPVLEWDLRTEPPEKWDYICESDIDADMRSKIEGIVAKFHRVVEK